jgi:HTH-type transcriptional regulator/antitoxin HipB
MQVRTDRDLGVLIRDRRRELGLDQATLAAQAEVSRQWIVGVEKGRPRAEVALLLRTLRVLGIELNATVAGSPASYRALHAGLVDIDAVIDRARGGRGKE